VRLGLGGDLLCDNFSYQGWLTLQGFKEKLQLQHGDVLNCRLDILRGVEKWIGHIHRAACHFLRESPDEEIQLILLPDPDPGNVQLCPFVSPSLWLQLWPQMKREPSYMTCENGRPLLFPRQSEPIVVGIFCGRCGAMSVCACGHAPHDCGNGSQLGADGCWYCRDCFRVSGAPIVVESNGVRFQT